LFLLKHRVLQVKKPKENKAFGARLKKQGTFHTYCAGLSFPALPSNAACAPEMGAIPACRSYTGILIAAALRLDLLLVKM